MHFKKFKLGGLTNMLRHYTREYIQEDGHIDKTKTHKNIILDGSVDTMATETNKDLQDCIKERTNKTMRKDAIVMVDLIITQPKQLGTDYDENFFKTMNKFCQDTFGIENQIYSVVHLDEKTPHMHFSFIPFTKDNRLCCKEILTRQFLKEFHTRAEKATGYQLTDTEDDRKKNLSLDDYKLLQELKKEVQEKKNEITNLDKEYNELSNTLNLIVSKKALGSPTTNEKKQGGINVPPKKNKSFIEQMEEIENYTIDKKMAILEQNYFINHYLKNDFEKVKSEIKNYNLEVKKIATLDLFIDNAKSIYKNLSFKSNTSELQNNQKNNLTL